MSNIELLNSVSDKFSRDVGKVYLTDKQATKYSEASKPQNVTNFSHSSLVTTKYQDRTGQCSAEDLTCDAKLTSSCNSLSVLTSTIDNVPERSTPNSNSSHNVPRTSLFSSATPFLPTSLSLPPGMKCEPSSVGGSSTAALSSSSLAKSNFSLPIPSSSTALDLSMQLCNSNSRKVSDNASSVLSSNGTVFHPPNNFSNNPVSGFKNDAIPTLSVDSPSDNGHAVKKPHKVTAQATIVPPLGTCMNDTPVSHKMTKTPPSSPQSRERWSPYKSIIASVKTSRTLQPPTEKVSGSRTSLTPSRFVSCKSPSKSPTTYPQTTRVESPSVSGAGSEVKGMPANPISQVSSKTARCIESGEAAESCDGGLLTIYQEGKMVLELAHLTGTDNSHEGKGTVWRQVKSKTYWPPSHDATSRQSALENYSSVLPPGSERLCRKFHIRKQKFPKKSGSDVHGFELQRVKTESNLSGEKIMLKSEKNFCLRLPSSYRSFRSSFRIGSGKLNRNSWRGCILDSSAEDIVSFVKEFGHLKMKAISIKKECDSQNLKVERVRKKHILETRLSTLAARRNIIIDYSVGIKQIFERLLTKRLSPHSCNSLNSPRKRVKKQDCDLEFSSKKLLIPHGTSIRKGSPNDCKKAIPALKGVASIEGLSASHSIDSILCSDSKSKLNSGNVDVILLPKLETVKNENCTESVQVKHECVPPLKKDLHKLANNYFQSELQDIRHHHRRESADEVHDRRQRWPDIGSGRSLTPCRPSVTCEGSSISTVASPAAYSCSISAANSNSVIDPKASTDAPYIAGFGTLPSSHSTPYPTYPVDPNYCYLLSHFNPLTANSLISSPQIVAAAAAAAAAASLQSLNSLQISALLSNYSYMNPIAFNNVMAPCLPPALTAPRAHHPPNVPVPGLNPISLPGTIPAGASSAASSIPLPGYSLSTAHPNVTTMSSHAGKTQTRSLTRPQCGSPVIGRSVSPYSSSGRSHSPQSHKSYSQLSASTQEFSTSSAFQNYSSADSRISTKTDTLSTLPHYCSSTDVREQSIEDMPLNLSKPREK